MLPDRFFFGKKDNNGCVFVSRDTLYSDAEGFGFVTQKNMREDENLRIPDLCDNFTLPEYFDSEDIFHIEQNDIGCYIDSKKVCEKTESEKGRLVPLYFRKRVTRFGNYRVTVTVTGTGEAYIFAGTRRLVFHGVLTGETEKISFIQNVCDIIPRGYKSVHERKSIDITVLGDDVILSEMEISQISCPTLYICGDSTVTDQSADVPYAPGTSYSGWGQMMPLHFADGISVSNHAHSGLTTESFREEGHYSIICTLIKPGDYIMFQFAHNDQKLEHLKAYDGYYKRLKEYINEARKFGAYPLIITPLARNTWKADGSGYNDLLKEYAESCISLGKECNVPVIDLHGFSMNEILRDGLETSKKYYFPKDYTHTNDYGAYKMSCYIAGELKKLSDGSFGNSYTRLGELVLGNVETWEPSCIPVVLDIPDKYKSINAKIGENKAPVPVERPDDLLLRAEALDMVIKAAKFFPTNVFNDIYDDIVGHEWYAGAVQCAYQNGIIPKGMIWDKCFRPEEKVNLEDFISFLMGAVLSRKGLPKEKSCPMDNELHDYSRSFVRAAFSMGLIGKDYSSKAYITRRRAAELCFEISKQI